MGGEAPDGLSMSGAAEPTLSRHSESAAADRPPGSGAEHIGGI